MDFLEWKESSPTDKWVKIKIYVYSWETGVVYQCEKKNGLGGSFDKNWKKSEKGDIEFRVELYFKN